MRGATLLTPVAIQAPSISIHAPHAGRDMDHYDKRQMEQVFQSTRPMRGATPPFLLGNLGSHISIHAPHAGRDELLRRHHISF